MSITLNLSKKAITQLEDAYQDVLVKPVPHSLFRAKTNNTMITAYHTGKVLFQGKGAEQEASRWQSLNTSTSEKNTQSTPSALPENIRSMTLIGSDEVGNGSYFGSLTVCAVYLDGALQKQMAQLGVQDSKNLSDARIRELATQIKQMVPYHLTICDPVDYNRGQSKLNANGMKVSLHNFTIQKLIQKLTDDQRSRLEGVFIDQFTSPSNYQRHLAKESHPYRGKTYFSTKGESQHLAVAAASIVARDAFLESLERLGEPFGVTLPSGAGVEVDRFASHLIRQHGPEILTQLTKAHFKNTEKAMNLAGNNKNHRIV